MNIIAVDDEKFALKDVLITLEEVLPNDSIRGYQDVTDALEYAKTNKIDIAFLDINMRGMSGLELAKRLKKIQPYVNIIFVTGYDDYLQKAINLHASGYLYKPIDEQEVREQINNLLYPVKQPQKQGVYVQTFGNFDIFVENKPLTFKRSKAKEVLAYLIDRNGSSVTKKEIAAVIFEDMPYTIKNQNYLTQIILCMMQTLEEHHLDHIIHRSYNSYSINRESVQCDAWQFLEGNPEALNSFHGEYMIQYSWAEASTGKFYEFYE